VRCDPLWRLADHTGHQIDLLIDREVLALGDEIVDSKRFWMAPKVLRSVLTEVSAASIREMVVLALATVVTEAEFSAELPRAKEVAL
jgi:hypothetical protein